MTTLTSPTRPSLAARRRLPWAFVRTGWQEVFLAQPVLWGLLVALGELTIAVLLLVGGRPARLGWIAAITFQGLLVLFGWGFLCWSVPFTVMLLLGARHDWPRLAT